MEQEPPRPLPVGGPAGYAGSIRARFGPLARLPLHASAAWWRGVRLGPEPGRGRCGGAAEPGNPRSQLRRWMP